MTLSMTFELTLKMTSKLYTDEDLDVKRVFEIRIRDLKERQNIKQKSFSLLVKKGVVDYISTEELKEKIKSFIRSL